MCYNIWCPNGLMVLLNEGILLDIRSLLPVPNLMYTLCAWSQQMPIEQCLPDFMTF